MECGLGKYQSLTHLLSFFSKTQKPYLPSKLEERNTQAEEDTKVSRKRSTQNIEDCRVRLCTAAGVQVQLLAYLHSTMWSTLPWMVRSPMTCQDRQKAATASYMCAQRTGSCLRQPGDINVLALLLQAL